MSAPLRTQVIPTDEFIESLVGQKISGGEETKDGMHLYFEDGRIMILSGYFVVYAGRLEPLN